MNGVQFRITNEEIPKMKQCGYEIYYRENKPYVLIETMDEVLNHKLNENEYYGTHIIWKISKYELSQIELGI